jgi:hypothetical protein
MRYKMVLPTKQATAAAVDRPSALGHGSGCRLFRR